MIRTCLPAPRLTLAAVAGLVLCTGGLAQGQDVKATVQIETGGQAPMTMDYWATEAGIRLDIAQPASVSIVWTSGASPTMLMIQHADRRYMEMGEQQMQMMRQMMQRMPNPGGAVGDSTIDVANLKFEPTGQTETIGPWTASGVRVTGLEGGEITVWIASDLDTGLFELFARMGDALEAMQMPMMGASGPQDQLKRYREIGNAAGVPDGGVVRMNMNDQNGATNITLQSFEKGSFGDALNPPAGYDKMQMPSLPQ
ncbi:MAG: hypothetical protein O3A25_12070 [Acidobacteria bacterium]|nr:hypothetical protein [Acidobacteriota bacterium]